MSLNMVERETEWNRIQEQQLLRENQRRAALNLEPLVSIEELEAVEVSDLLLDQAAQVVADMAALEEIPAELELVTTSADSGD